ncbi:unnamed protein product [Arabis nemorensis]|uniref:Uncharacterized protein n=1 Tax=Arabis nemorensis TaxID=586526 RepID=A0A565BDN3_9BRAS|nr:unnamed protein product [Arabis nemorensis]
MEVEQGEDLILHKHCKAMICSRRDCVVDVKGYLSKERGLDELELGGSVLNQKFIKTVECSSPKSNLSRFSRKEEEVVKEEE